MSQQQGIVKGDTLQKLGSLGLIIGGILLIIFNLIFPHPADPTNIQDAMTTWGSKAGLVKFAELFRAVGSLGIMIGAAAVYRSITARGAAWARLGFYGIIVGTAVATISSGVMKNMANIFALWLGAPDDSKATMFTASVAVVTVCSAVFTMYILVEWLAIAFLGIGMARSQVYPKWFGWVASTLGILTIAAVGIPYFLTSLTSTILTSFGVLAILTSIWALIVGIWVARKAW